MQSHQDLHMELPWALDWKDVCLFVLAQLQTQIFPVSSHWDCLELLVALAQGNAEERYFDGY